MVIVEAPAVMKSTGRTVYYSARAVHEDVGERICRRLRIGDKICEKAHDYDHLQIV